MNRFGPVAVIALLMAKPHLCFGSPITRTQVVSNAQLFLTSSSVTVVANNLVTPRPFPGGLTCDLRHRPNQQNPNLFRLCSGDPYLTEAYFLGGFDSPSTYRSRQSSKWLVQDTLIDGAPIPNPNFTGIDCSGYVSQAWGLNQHLATSDLLTNSNSPIVLPVNVNAMQAGDAFVYGLPGGDKFGHAVLLPAQRNH